MSTVHYQLTSFLGSNLVLMLVTTAGVWLLLLLLKLMSSSSSVLLLSCLTVVTGDWGLECAGEYVGDWDGEHVGEGVASTGMGRMMQVSREAIVIDEWWSMLLIPESGLYLMWSWVVAPLFGGGEIGLKWLVGVSGRWGWSETGLVEDTDSSWLFFLNNWLKLGTDTGLADLLGFHSLSRNDDEDDGDGVGEVGLGGEGSLWSWMIDSISSSFSARSSDLSWMSAAWNNQISFLMLF